MADGLMSSCILVRSANQLQEFGRALLTTGSPWLAEAIPVNEYELLCGMMTVLSDCGADTWSPSELESRQPAPLN